jgi:hypothetical protein
MHGASRKDYDILSYEVDSPQSTDPFTYWDDKSEDYPSLSVMAKQYLSYQLQASSVRVAFLKAALYVIKNAVFNQL